MPLMWTRPGYSVEVILT